jgi:glycosidase
MPHKINKPIMEFHISKKSRLHYDFDESLFSLNGNVVFTNFVAARRFAHKMNSKRDMTLFPERVIKAGHINAMGLIDEILHFIVFQYKQLVNPSAMDNALKWLNTRVGNEKVEKILREFTEEFPPLRVYKGELEVNAYLEGKTEGIPNTQIALEELIMLWLANINPAFSPYTELFDDRDLLMRTAYSELINEIQDFFETQPPFVPDGETLIRLLRAPAIASPNSLSGQLKFLLEHWSHLLGKYYQSLLSSLDFIQEEEKPRFFGPGPSQILQFSKHDLIEEERFSPDKDWMPHLVLLAKNAYVWLDQLSKEYQQQITRLEQVPHEELDKLARWGITGLWLIGLWERSSASRRIKQMCGNPDAVASAYSLYDYVIANRLGGESSFEVLRQKAWEHGIRLAADMVPNHVGIYSKWVIEHPDWFISLDYNPFPSYDFSGENLSENDRVGIYLENHYYSQNDAAVVFKRVDHWTGAEKYIYHGNDGTSMPWNDTAQLNFLNPEVREAVIQTILHVARKFQVIRFDAAMTLAKKHFQRLWYPQPGSGGDIPSRAGFGLTKEQYDAIMPVEFWREVVDRVAQEAPDTLLLAEAFWMMEGYFVRTLGMHRVYNSAFMNMLRDEKNEAYRQLIKNTLEFDPEILKRYVNFMNNPDEKTAIDQFGKDDKYFGICTLMATMPGLPMFGHGQIEGFHEKYGMEYYRAYWDETPDQALIQRHEKEIFPLLHRRSLFADVKDFYLYDYFGMDGNVNENVFAYSNRIGTPGSGHSQRALVIYHNRFADVKGSIKMSAAFKDKSREDEGLLHTSLGSGLGLRNDEHSYIIFKDHVTGLEYIRNSKEFHEQGLFIELGAYKYHVFLDFRQVFDNEWHHYQQVCDQLHGNGTPSIDRAIQEILLRPIHEPFKELVNEGFYRWLIENREKPGKPTPLNLESAIAEAEAKINFLLNNIQNYTDQQVGRERITDEVIWKLRASLILPILMEKYPYKKSRKYKYAYRFMVEGDHEFESLSKGSLIPWGILLNWLFTHNLWKVNKSNRKSEPYSHIINDWRLENIIADTMIALGSEPEKAWEAVLTIKILCNHQDWIHDTYPQKGRSARLLTSLLDDVYVHRLLQVNTFQDIVWFNKEALESLCRWLLIVGCIDLMIKPDMDGLRTPEEGVAEDIVALYDVINNILKAVDSSDYQLDRLIEIVK